MYLTPGSKPFPRYPKKIKLAGIEVSTVINDALLEEQKAGKAAYHEQSIEVLSKGLPVETMEQCYVHELVHWILFIMNSEKQQDEAFIDMFAHLLYQALQTAEWSEEWEV